MIEEVLNNKIIDKHLLIFDLDGTLIDTDEVNFLAYKEAIQKIKKIDLTLLHKNDERFTREKLHSIIADLKTQEYESIIEVKNNVYYKYLHKSRINDFILKIIVKFSQTNKIVLATNSRKYRANMIFKYHNLINFFDYTFYKEDYKNQENNKFKHILNYLNIDPNLAIVFENDSNEIKKAIFSGVPNKNIVQSKHKDKNMNEFTISSNEKYLKNNVQSYYHTYYTRYKQLGNPDYLNDLKNTFNDFSNENLEKLDNAIQQLYDVLKNDLSSFNRNLTICIVPRSKSEDTYDYNQLLFKEVIQDLINELNFKDGSDYIVRHTDTKTTHLAHSQHAGDGDMPYPGITKETCKISNKVNGKDILLIDDIYTKNVNIDEDAIQALFDNYANSIVFYAVGKTV